MKTSFYFVLWILIYPVLGLFHSEAVYRHSFLIALVAVYGISWLLNRSMPRILLYERVSHIAPILEDVYTGNVKSFSRRLFKDALIETVTAFYFCVTTVVLAVAMFQTRENDWLALLVFGFFATGAIIRSSRLVNAWFKLKSEPTPEQCMEIADDTYKLDYASYYESHLTTDYEGMFPPRPKYFKAFQIVSLVFAVIATLFGLVFIFSGVLGMIYGHSFENGGMSGMYFLYGSLAAYFGIKDIIDIGNALKSNPRTVAGETSR